MTVPRRSRDWIISRTAKQPGEMELIHGKLVPVINLTSGEHQAIHRPSLGLPVNSSDGEKRNG